MTFKEVCEKYKIDKKEIVYFVDEGVIAKDNLDDDAIKRIGQIILFLKAGFEKDSICRYFLCDKSLNGKTEQAQMLRRFREKLLDNVHDKQKQLDQIDYILYKLEDNR